MQIDFATELVIIVMKRIENRHTIWLFIIIEVYNKPLRNNLNVS